MPNSIINEKDLAITLQKAEPDSREYNEAFQKLWDYLFPKVKGYVIKRWGNNLGQIEDVATELFDDFILRRLPKYNPVYPFGSFFWQSMKWLIWDRYSKKKSMKEKQTVSMNDSSGVKKPPEEDVEYALKRELEEEREEAINKIPNQNYQTAVKLRLQGEKFREIAQITGRNIDTVKSDFGRGVKAVQQILRKQGII